MAPYNGIHIMAPQADTKKKGQYFSLTINNPTDEQIDDYKVSLPEGVAYMIWSLEEAPTTGTKHIQAHVHTKQLMRMTGLKKIFPTAHIELSKANLVKNQAYVSKSETHLEGPFELGTTVKKGQRTDLDSIYDIVKKKTKTEFIMDHPAVYSKMRHAIDYQYQHKYMVTKRDKPQVIVLYGEPGTGKTRYAYDKHPQECIYKMARTNTTEKVWFNGYDPETHKVLLLDDFYGWIPYSFLLQLLDRYPMMIETKGGMTNLLVDTIYITSNSCYDKWYSYDNNKDIRALKRRLTDVIHVKKRVDKKTIIDAFNGSK